MEQKQQQTVNQEPLQSHFRYCRRVFAFEIAFSCCYVNDKRPDECHKYRRGGVETRCSGEDIDSKTYYEAVENEFPMWDIKRHQHHKKHINAKVNVVPKMKVIENQHLHDEQNYKSYYIAYQCVIHNESISDLKLFFTTKTCLSVLKFVVNFSFAVLNI